MLENVAVFQLKAAAHNNTTGLAVKILHLVGVALAFFTTVFSIQVLIAWILYHLLDTDAVVDVRVSQVVSVKSVACDDQAAQPHCFENLVVVCVLY